MLFYNMVVAIVAVNCVTAAPLRTEEVIALRHNASQWTGNTTNIRQPLAQVHDNNNLSGLYSEHALSHHELPRRGDVGPSHHPPQFVPYPGHRLPGHRINTTTQRIPVPMYNITSIRPKPNETLAKPDVFKSEAGIRDLVPRHSINPSLCTWSRDTPNFNVIPSSCGVSWLQLINKWRAAYNKSPFTWSPHNAQISYTAGLNNQGGARTPFQHSDLRAVGSNGETGTSGYIMPASGARLYGTLPFEGALLAWLCEVPGPELKPGGIDLCKEIVADQNHINVSGQRGHHDVFLGDYKSIGCWFTYHSQKPEGVFAGMYVCNYSR